MASNTAECSVGRNPLAQFTKHVGEDRSLQRDRLAGPSGTNAASSSSAPGAAMRTFAARPMNAADQNMMEGFMSQVPMPVGQDNLFAFDSMRQEVMDMYKAQHNQATFHASKQLPTASQHQWSQEFASRMQPQQPQQQADGARSADWISQYSAAGGTPGVLVQPGPQLGRSIYNMPMGSLYSSSMMFNAPAFAPAEPMMTRNVPAQQSRIVELQSSDWEEQFKHIEAENPNEEDVAQEEENGISASDVLGDETFHGDFESIWRGIQERHMQDGTASEVGYVNNLDSTTANVFENERFQDVLDNEAYNPFNINSDTGEITMPWDKDFEEFSASRHDAGDYQFEPENTYKSEDLSDPFAEGVRLMETGGNLSEAALAFEAAVQKNPEHVEAWTFLGTVQAQNEKEDPAIRALERAVKLDPDSQTALMNLAVSYINEGYENAAYATLERWIATKYPDIVSVARGQQPSLSDADRFRLHDRVTELFLRAAQLSPEGMSMDADVQVGLGVLFYGNEEYDKAVDCFSAALSVRPDDPLMWNRLGATLANSRRSEEAIEAYYKALELRPSFVRARYNLGVSCINIGCYKEAAQHLLTALEMHRIPNGQVAASSSAHASDDEVLANQSTNLYETLRRVFVAMDRRDLADKVINGVDPAMFRGEF
ncbi:uncharacterized protein V1518DRAFT_392809 [Limtongia smithiae]|uniref:uncharacterized protein n=1 Tax=Limtongia smithiae TaxID=1125753 RepID=UPI0034CD34EF